LTSDIPDEGLKADDMGVIVHVHQHGEAFEVEFFGVDGHTLTVATVLASQVRPVGTRDIIHIREI